jgi:hypothetical protein
MTGFEMFRTQIQLKNSVYGYIIDFSTFGFIVLDTHKTKTPSQTGFLYFLGLSYFKP